MNQKKTIGLAVVTHKTNFGSALQTYATQRAIRQLGFETRIFDIDSVKKDIDRKKIRYFMGRLFEKQERQYLVGSLVSRLKKNNQTGEYSVHMRMRKDAYDRFYAKHLVFFDRANGWDGLREQSRECSAVVVGSDQNWRPSNIIGDFFTLSFAAEGVDRIAYATSFGVSELPKSLHRKTRQFLSKMTCISVRENSGQTIVKELSGRDCEVVCDPSMLLTAEEWDEVAENKRVIPEDYILCYFMGKNRLHREFADRLRAQTGLKIVGLMHGSTYIAEDEGFADIEPYDVGPERFLDLVKNAEFICTDSFHASVFSILYQRPFFVFKRFPDDSPFSTNDRIHTLLGRCGLETRLIRGDEDAAEMMRQTIDFESAQKMIDKMRERSFLFLKNALDRSNDSEISK